MPLHRILINIYGATWWIPVALVMGFFWRSIWNSVAKSTNDFVIHCYHPPHQRSLEGEEEEEMLHDRTIWKMSGQLVPMASSVVFLVLLWQR